MNEDRITRSSGNVFEDLGLADAEEALAKADLTRQIGRLIGRRGWTQQQAAQVLGIDQPKVSALMRGRLGGFSIERLIHFLNDLDQQVEISVRAKAATTQHARLRVHIEDDPGDEATMRGATEAAPARL